MVQKIVWQLIINRAGELIINSVKTPKSGITTMPDTSIRGRLSGRRHALFERSVIYDEMTERPVNGRSSPGTERMAQVEYQIKNNLIFGDVN